MSGYDLENKATIAVLLALIGVYLYLLLAPSDGKNNINRKTPFNFVIKRDSRAAFDDFVRGMSAFADDRYSGYTASYNASEFNTDWMSLYKDGAKDGWGAAGARDDFFLDAYAAENTEEEEGDKEDREGDDNTEVLPSANALCLSGWLTIRSQVNYKFLWMHADERQWMGASATMDTPLHRKTFFVSPVSLSAPSLNAHSTEGTSGVQRCAQGEGWSLLREGDSQNFIRMISPTRSQTHSDNVSSLTHNNDTESSSSLSPSLREIAQSSDADEMWTIQLGTTNVSEAERDPAYHFLLEREGFLLNRKAGAFVNILAQADYPARGHTASHSSRRRGNNDISTHRRRAGREFGAALHFTLVNESEVMSAIAREAEEEKRIAEQEEIYLQQIQTLYENNNKNKEKRVIAFGLYGEREKYTTGAIRNAELEKKYFPGWVCRFYVTEDVPQSVREKLLSLGAELKEIPSGMGYTSGMFWRFLVAADPTVDRFIIRDADSRLNARDSLAVAEWIESKQPVHILRDHVNHCIVMNGGMWGAVKGAIPDMEEKVRQWENRNEYMADLHFLDHSVWPQVKDRHIAHDSYCCDRYPNTKPFPTQRYVNYQHVGQVFDAQDRARLTDIDGFIRGVPVPSSCRKQPDWIYG